MNLLMTLLLFSHFVQAQDCHQEKLEDKIICQSNHHSDENIDLFDFVSFFEPHVIAYLQLDNQKKIKVWIRPPLLAQRLVRNEEVLRLSCQNKIKHVTKSGFMCEIVFNHQKELKVYIHENGKIDKRLLITGL